MSEWVASFEEATKEVVCDEPGGVLAVAWAVYRQAILDLAYYFSPSELLFFAHLGDTNLVTTQYSHGAFAVVGQRQVLREVISFSSHDALSVRHSRVALSAACAFEVG